MNEDQEEEYFCSNTVSENLVWDLRSLRKYQKKLLLRALKRRK